jgi:hypothetical protein
MLMILIAVSCKDSGDKTSDQSKDDLEVKIPLIEKQIGDSGYSMSIPMNYSIKTHDGPDFSVYYFSPTDTTINNKLTGGLYLGNSPGLFNAENDSCKIEMFKGKVLNQQQNWTVYNCQKNYSIQTIVKNKEGEEWNQTVHVFGKAKSKDELQVILKIFSTLKKR